MFSSRHFNRRKISKKGLIDFSPQQRTERIQSNATQFHEAQVEAQDPSRREEALQYHRDRKDFAHAFRQATPAGHQGSEEHAKAQQVDASQQVQFGNDQAVAYSRP